MNLHKVPTCPSRRRLLTSLAAGSLCSVAFAQSTDKPAVSMKLQSWPLETPRATGIHDLAPAPDGGVWFTAQRSGHLGWFDPKSGKTELVSLGRGSSPHGVIQGPDGAAWITDGGQNAIARVAWPSRTVKLFPLPPGSPGELMWPAFQLPWQTVTQVVFANFLPHQRRRTRFTRSVHRNSMITFAGRDMVQSRLMLVRFVAG